MSEAQSALPALDAGGAKSLSDIAATMHGGMPPVQDYIKEASQNEPEGPQKGGQVLNHPKKVDSAQLAKGKTDQWKRPFDPALHVVDAEGKPVFTRSGNLKAKSKGKAPTKPAAKNPAAASGVSPSSSRLDANRIGGPQAAEADRQTAAQVAQAPMQEEEAKQRRNCAAMFVMVGTNLAGQLFDADEWKPEADEQNTLVDATEAYFAEHGISDITPGWQLLFCVAAYSLPRLAKPKTKEKITAITQWVSGKKTPSVGVAKKATKVPTREEYEAAEKAQTESHKQTNGGFEPMPMFHV